MPPHPHAGPPAPRPSPAAECLETYIPLFRFKLFPPLLDGDRLLEQVTLLVLDLTFLSLEATGQRGAIPQPAGMASKGGKPVGWRGVCFRDPAVLQMLGI